MGQIIITHSIIYVLVGLLVLFATDGKSSKAFFTVFMLSFIPYLIRLVMYFIEGTWYSPNLEGVVMMFSRGAFEAIYFLFVISIFPIMTFAVSLGIYRSITLPKQNY